MFIKHESALLAVLKGSLMNMYSKSFKNLNLDNSSLLADQSSQKLLSYFSKKTTQSTQPTSTQLKSLDQENASKQQQATNKRKTRKYSTSDSDSDSDVTVTESTQLNPKTKVPKISMYFDNESIIPDRDNRNNQSMNNVTNHRDLLNVNDKENLFQSRIGSKSPSKAGKIYFFIRLNFFSIINIEYTTTIDMITAIITFSYTTSKILSFIYLLK